jgi:hypothetical protein
MVKWGSTLNTCVHAYETEINLSMEAFQLKFVHIVYIVYIVHIPLYHKSKVIIVVSSYLKVDSFALLSKNRFSVLHRIKCLKLPEYDIDLKKIECKVMLIIFLSLH